MSVRKFESLNHYLQVTGNIQDGCTVAMCVIDNMAPQCWDIISSFNDAASNPNLNQTQFFFLDISNLEMEKVMEDLSIGSVPMVAFFRAGEGVRTCYTGSSEVHALIAQYCQ